MLTSYTVEIRVRYPEVDPMGLLHHSRYYVYFEIARTEMYRASGGNYRDLEKSGVFFVVVETGCKYHKPAYYDDILHVTCTIIRVTRAKLVHEYRVMRGEDLLAVGHVTLAMVDSHGRVLPIPEEFMLK